MVRSFEPNEPTIRKLAKFVKEEKCYDCNLIELYVNINL